jgi:hypothetical protein
MVSLRDSFFRIVRFSSGFPVFLIVSEFAPFTPADYLATALVLLGFHSYKTDKEFHAPFLQEEKRLIIDYSGYDRG